MFSTTKNLLQLKMPHHRRWRETVLASLTGIALTLAVFQAIYFAIFALE